MRFTNTTLFMALQLAGASRLPRSDAIEYSTLQGVEAFNATFAEAHLANFEGPVLEYDAGSSSGGPSTRATGNVYVCINAGFQPACTLVHWNNNACGKSCQPFDARKFHSNFARKKTLPFAGSWRNSNVADE